MVAGQSEVGLVGVQGTPRPQALGPLHCTLIPPGLLLAAVSHSWELLLQARHGGASHSSLLSLLWQPQGQCTLDVPPRAKAHAAFQGRWLLAQKRMAIVMNQAR